MIFLIIFIDDLISLIVDKPVDKMMGFFNFAISFTNLWSVNSKEAILYMGGLKVFKK